ncbi:hypothetical protein M413DRAFT_437846 [Hebeloma cylindrosporum]|uniref:Uncharacterized protein n=1 Tax=Hebeloma cylindrosporum TaxID=76867 RepID=A0A0C2Z670_HEBCY|nr:hypothetical protein M413DRAFT_437846 [Hebeloma cylindrosporum h7]
MNSGSSSSSSTYVAMGPKRKARSVRYRHTPTYTAFCTRFTHESSTPSPGES